MTFNKLYISSKYHDSLFDLLQNSYHMEFIRLINEYYKDDTHIILDELESIKIILMGNESVGKTSLLKELTNCKLFDHKILNNTKLPLCIKLRTVFNTSNISCKLIYKNITESININNIVDKIKCIINEINNDNIETINLMIEICDLNIPTLEIYDLPGIRYVNNLLHKTRFINEYYLQKNNSIIICTIPAITQNINKINFYI